MKKRLIAVAIFLVAIFVSNMIVYAGPHGGGVPPTPPPSFRLSIPNRPAVAYSQFDFQDSTPVTTRATHISFDTLCQ